MTVGSLLRMGLNDAGLLALGLLGLSVLTTGTMLLLFWAAHRLMEHHEHQAALARTRLAGPAMRARWLGRGR